VFTSRMLRERSADVAAFNAAIDAHLATLPARGRVKAAWPLAAFEIDDEEVSATAPLPLEGRRDSVPPSTLTQGENDVGQEHSVGPPSFSLGRGCRGGRMRSSVARRATDGGGPPPAVPLRHDSARMHGSN